MEKRVSDFMNRMSPIEDIPQNHNAKKNKEDATAEQDSQSTSKEDADAIYNNVYNAKNYNDININLDVEDEVEDIAKDNTKVPYTTKATILENNTDFDVALLKLESSSIGNTNDKSIDTKNIQQDHEDISSNTAGNTIGDIDYIANKTLDNTTRNTVKDYDVTLLKLENSSIGTLEDTMSNTMKDTPSNTIDDTDYIARRLLDNTSSNTLENSTEIILSVISWAVSLT